MYTDQSGTSTFSPNTTGRAAGLLNYSSVMLSMQPETLVVRTHQAELLYRATYFLLQEGGVLVGLSSFLSNLTTCLRSGRGSKYRHCGRVTRRSNWRCCLSAPPRAGTVPSTTTRDEWARAPSKRDRRPWFGFQWSPKSENFSAAVHASAYGQLRGAKQ